MWFYLYIRPVEVIDEKNVVLPPLTAKKHKKTKKRRKK
jgi:hypothetical protein